MIPNMFETNEKWRKRLLDSYFVVAVVIAVVEFIMFFFDEWAGLLFLPKRIYFIRFFIAPSAVNLLMVFLCRYGVKKDKIKDETKNRMVGWLLAGICLVTQVTHYVFGPILCACGLAIFMSCVFGDRKHSFSITVFAYVALAISVLEGMFELRKGDNQLFLDTAVAAVFYFCCYLTARNLISKYESDKAMIQEALQKQITLLEQTRRDPLTNLYNRKAMFDNIGYDIGEKKENMWLAVLDMDDFKKVNDSYGHATGDVVLCFLAATLHQNETDTVSAYRFGGEEFALLFIRKDRSEMFAVLEEVRRKLEEETFSYENKDFHVTVSIGAALYDEVEMTVDDFFTAADMSMYLSKQEGKNRITITEKNSVSHE